MIAAGQAAPALPGPAQGMLLPDLPALVRWDAATARLELVDFSTGERISAAGRFAQEAWSCLGGAPAGPALQALPQQHPLSAWLARRGAEERLPLAPAAALRLGGFRTLFLELTGRCNQRCVHCYAAAGPDVAAALKRETCESLIAEVPALGFEHVQLTGGEPLLCPFLPELVARIAALRGPSCEIYSNGLLLDERLLDAIAVHRPRLAFSFYSSRPEVHDAITRTPGSQQRTSAAIQRAVARGLQVRVAVVASALNADHLAQTAAHVESLGVRSVAVGRAFAVGRGELHEGPLPATSAATATGRRAAAPKPAARPRGRGRLCVAADGAVYPCIFNRGLLLGRVPERRLSEIAADPLRDWPDAPAAPGADDGAALLARLRRQVPCVECQLVAYALSCAPGAG